jgi:hypothetical protein
MFLHEVVLRNFDKREKDLEIIEGVFAKAKSHLKRGKHFHVGRAKEHNFVRWFPGFSGRTSDEIRGNAKMLERSEAVT